MKIKKRNALTPEDELKLFKAIEENDVEVCRAVISNGIDWNRVICSYHDGQVTAEYLPLHLAAYSGAADVCELFIEHGADPHCYKKSWTALHHAAVWGMVDACKVLIKHGAQIAFVPESPPRDYLTPLQKAIEYAEVDYDVLDVIRLFVTEFGERLDQRSLDGRSFADLTNNEQIQRTLRSLQTELAVAGGMDGASAVARPAAKRSSDMSPL